jgi:ABC-type antimicrobial peptide transport system permease subunit
MTTMAQTANRWWSSTKTWRGTLSADRARSAGIFGFQGWAPFRCGSPAWLVMSGTGGLAGDDQSRVRDQMYSPFAQVPMPMLRFFSSVMSIAVRTKTPPLNAVRPLQQELHGASGDQALYEPRAMEQLVSASLARQRFLLFLFGLFAGIALLLASIGIYGVLAYLTGQRAAEIGVRVALGATARDVVWMVLGQCLRMVLAGLAAGIFAALVAGRVLQNLVQGMQPLHATTFAVVIPLLAAAALAAGFVPARRASRVDPVRSLRQE